VDREEIEEIDSYPEVPTAPEGGWDIRREGRSWDNDEALPRLEMMPEKTEMTDGKLYWTEQDRLVVLGLLLENVGVDRAIRLGDPAVWRAAIAALDEE